MVATVRWMLWLVALTVAACGSDSEDEAGQSGRCLSDAEICQFTEGVSTMMDVQRKLGNAQQYVGSSAIYVCQQISGQTVVHNDIVSFSFDSSGILQEVLAIRQGTAATPIPSCAQ